MDDERIAELERDLDFVAIGGGEIIHDHDAYYAGWYDIPTSEAERLRPSRFFIEGLGEQAERSTPVAWHSVGIPFDLEGGLAERIRVACSRRSYVSVRDERSRARLVRAGVQREVVIAPDSALLLRRLVAPEVLVRRLGYLKAIRAFPGEGRPLVVQGSRALLPYVEDEIGRSLATSSMNRTFPCCSSRPARATAMASSPTRSRPSCRSHARTGCPRRRLSRTLLAAIAHSGGFVGISLHGSIAAFAFGIPFAILDLVGYTKLLAFAELAGAEAMHVTFPQDVAAAIARVLAGERARADIGPLAARIDAHFDRLAELAEMSAARRNSANLLAPASNGALQSALSDAELRYASLRRAYEARSQALLRERARMMSIIERHERSDGLQHLLDQLERSQARLAAAQGEIVRLRADLAHSGAIGHTKRMRSLIRSQVLRDGTPLARVWARMRDASLR